MRHTVGTLFPPFGRHNMFDADGYGAQLIDPNVTVSNNLVLFFGQFLREKNGQVISHAVQNAIDRNEFSLNLIKYEIDAADKEAIIRFYIDLSA